MKTEVGIWIDHKKAVIATITDGAGDDETGDVEPGESFAVLRQG